MNEKDWIDHFLIPAIKAHALFGALVLATPVLVLVERKVLGWIQQRPGPDRVGPWGILQTIVDGIKLVLKEDFIPAKADRFTFMIAPLIALIPAFLAISIVPMGPSVDVNLFGKDRTIDLMVADLPVGILFYFAATSLGVYGIVLAGWASNSKYALLGGIRSSAQLISYELTLALSLIGVLLIVGDFRMTKIVESQSSFFLDWNIVKQPLGAMLFLIGGFAETNRLPFDLPEGESELGAGFHTEYSSLRWAMFFMAEYINITGFSAIFTTLFLGGWHLGVPFLEPAAGTLAGGLLGLAVFGGKVFFLFFFFVWVRGTLPRLRYDQLMDLGWKYLFPIALVNVIVTAFILSFGLGLPGKDGLASSVGAVLEWILLVGSSCFMIWRVDRMAIRNRERTLGHAG